MIVLINLIYKCFDILPLEQEDYACFAVNVLVSTLIHAS
jgi:hypothetical protein